ncbi:MAG: gamma-glutamylcyclotransferase [Saccharospirillum sp.]|nr:gamma-glutamylcyclotransferase [Saccharospirillum sp.]
MPKRMRAFLKTQDLTDMSPVIDEVLRRKPDEGPLWVFGYGSLIWNPDMDYTADCAATLPGYYRDFCLSSIVHRGTPEQPGVVLGVRQNSHSECFGHAFCLDPEQHHPSLERLLFRELVSDCYLPLWLPLTLQTGQTVQALTMVVNETHERFIQLTEEEMLARIRVAKGPRGSNLDYLNNLVRHFQSCGIEDKALFQLYQRSND